MRNIRKPNKSVAIDAIYIQLLSVLTRFIFATEASFIGKSLPASLAGATRVNYVKKLGRGFLKLMRHATHGSSALEKDGCENMKRGLLDHIYCAAPSSKLLTAILS